MMKNSSEEKKNKNFKTVINILDSNRILKEEKERSARVSKQDQESMIRPKENAEDYNQHYYSKPPSLQSQKQSISSIAKEGSQASKQRIQPASPSLKSPRHPPSNKASQISQISHQSNRFSKVDDHGVESRIKPTIQKATH